MLRATRGLAVVAWHQLSAVDLPRYTTPRRRTSHHSSHLWTDLELPVQLGGVAVARRRQQSPQWRHQVVGVDARHTAAQRRTDHVIITTHPFNGTVPFAWLPGWAGTRKVKPIWILLKQETVSGTGISRAIRKSAPCSGQITMPAPHHSVFYRPDALPAAQPTASKHWRSTRHNNNNNNNKWRRMRSKVHSSLIFVLVFVLHSVIFSFPVNWVPGSKNNNNNNNEQICIAL